MSTKLHMIRNRQSSLLAPNGLPQLFPGPGHPLTGMSKNTPARNIPFAGWRALPALGAMQEPIPDFRFALHNT